MSLLKIFYASSGRAHGSCKDAFAEDNWVDDDWISKKIPQILWKPEQI